MKRRTYVVDTRIPPDERGRFRVFVHGGIQYLKLDTIKAAIENGHDVRDIRS